MWKFIKKLFGVGSNSELKEETRVISQDCSGTVDPSYVPSYLTENNDKILCNVVRYLYNRGRFAKHYKCVIDFISNREFDTNSVCDIIHLSEMKFSEKSEKFIRTYQLRKCKCLNQQFQSWIEGYGK